jgi:20S proteasome subunit beta 4
VLVAGVNDSGVPSLHWIDYISNMQQLPFAAHGYAAYFCMSTMDRYYEPDMTLDQVLKLLKKCLTELQVRFVANLPAWTIKLVDKDGVREISLADYGL